MPTVIDIRTISDHFPGIGRYGYQLVRALGRRKDRDDLILLSNSRSSNTRFDVLKLAAEPNIRIVSTEAEPFTAREQLFLPGELRKLNPSLIHFPYLVLPYLAPLPVVLTIHDIIPLMVPRFFNMRNRILFRVSLALAMRRARTVICISEATRLDLRNRLHSDPSRTAVIPLAVDDSFHPCLPEELGRVRTAYGLPDHYILYVGSCKPHKNLPALIAACARLTTAPPLVIAGSEDPRYPESRRMVEQMSLKERVRFLGPVKEEHLPGLYGGARALVFPSLYEGFGLPPLESMACGVPVACSNLPSLREAAGDAALFFDPKDQDSIRSAVHRILEDEPLRADLRNRGFRRAAELSWDTVAEKTLEVYKSVLSG